MGGADDPAQNKQAAVARDGFLPFVPLAAPARAGLLQLPTSCVGRGVSAVCQGEEPGGWGRAGAAAVQGG